MLHRLLSIVFLFGLPSASFAQTPATPASAGILPAPLYWAMQEVHSLAAQTKVRNLFMYKYSYYAGGFCADQDCSAKFVESQMNALQAKMGAQFGELIKDYPYYANEIRIAQQSAPHRDLDSLISERSVSEILSRSVFITCIDFSKAVAFKALSYGMNPQDLRFFWTMAQDGYLKMCPTRNGQPAIAPRPLVHTIIAFRSGGNWYVLNTENPDFEIIPLGPQLPQRLSMSFDFTKPPLVSGVTLIYAGSYDFAGFLTGFPNQMLLNITASGIQSASPADFVCR